MNVIVHTPGAPEGLRALRKQVAAVYAQAVVQYIEKLDCPEEQKLRLLRAVTEEAARP